MTLLAFLVLLGVLITVHEFGHFIVARLCGVRVLTFSIGFGPKLIGFKRGETEYRISVLPLGGFVRMFGDDITVEVAEADKAGAHLEKSYPRKMAIAAAGPAANILLALVLFFVMGLGDDEVARPVVGTVLAGEVAERAGLRPGDTIVAVEGQPIATFNDLIAAVSPRANQPTAITVQRPGVAAPIVLSATPSASPSPDPLDDAPVGRLGLLASPALPVVTVAADSAAAKAGVAHGDVVKSINGVEVASRDALTVELDKVAIDAALTLVVERKALPTTPPAPAAPVPTPGKHTIVIPAPPAPPPVPVPPAVDVDGAGCVSDTATVGAAPGQLTSCAAPTAEMRARAEADAAAVAAREVVLPPTTRLTFAVTDAEIVGPVAEQVAAVEELVRQAQLQQRRWRGLASVEGVIASVAADTPAAARGLVPNEHRVVAVDGQPLRLSADLPVALSRNLDGIHVLGLVDGKGAGQVFVLLLAPHEDRKIVGATLTSAMGKAPTMTIHVGVVQAARNAVVALGEATRAVAGGYVALATGKVGLDQLGGPVMMANIAGEAAEAGPSVFGGMMALLSINLALLNLLPVPVLDGGHLLLFTIEAVRRRRLSAEARIRATTIGLVFVGLLMVIGLFNDVGRYFH
jgi:membrane-associated protease RseP (regulator of RpoE activity)